MVIKNTGKRKYYIFQDGKQVGKVNKKNNSYVINNLHPVTIKQSSRVKEIIFYVIALILLVVCCIWGRPMLLVLFVVCGRVFDPFNLTSKSDIYFPRAKGDLFLHDDFKHECKEEFLTIKRPMFLTIRFISIVGFFLALWELFIENYLIYKTAYWIGFMVGYGVLFLIFVPLITRAYIRNLKAAKLERTEQEKLMR